MAREFYVYGTSSYCKEFYPTNKAEDFIIHLPKPIHLEGEWECGLVSFQYNASAEKPYYVCCDLVTQSYVGDYMLPLLRRVRLKNVQYANVLYIALRIRDFNSIRVYMKSWKNKEASGVKGRSYCTFVEWYKERNLNHRGAFGWDETIILYLHLYTRL